MEREKPSPSDAKSPYGNIDGVATLTGDTLTKTAIARGKYKAAKEKKRGF